MKMKSENEIRNEIKRLENMKQTEEDYMTRINAMEWVLTGEQNVCDSTRSVYPLLADVLAEIESINMIENHPTLELDRERLKEVLSKYFR